MAEIGLVGIALGDGKLGQVIAFERQVHVAAFGDQQGVAQGFGNLGEQLAHLLGCAQVVGLVRHAHPVGIGQHRLRLDRKQDILQPRILGVDVMHVVGCDELRGMARAHFNQASV